MDDATADRASRLARDWTTIWQSELAALATDPETATILELTFAACLAAGEPWLKSWPNPSHESDSSRGGGDGRLLHAGSDAPPGSPPAAAAPGPNDDALATLQRRVAELERRIAELDPGHDGGAGPDGAISDGSAPGGVG